MGSLSSRPTAPTIQPQIIAPPTPQTVPQSAPQPSSPVNTEASTETQSTASQNRSNNLLRRNRGRIGTIQTSFRGLLSQSNKGPQRKTLLGE